MPPIETTLLYTLGVVGLLWYYVCLIWIGLRPLPAGVTPSEFRQHMSHSVTIISASLATFVGMLLGLQDVARDVKEGVQVPHAELKAGLASVGDPAAPTMASKAERVEVNAARIVRSAEPGVMQWVAAGAYLLSLLLGLAFWARHGKDSDPAVSNLGKSLIGLIAGALAVLLNVSGP